MGNVEMLQSLRYYILRMIHPICNFQCFVSSTFCLVLLKRVHTPLFEDADYMCCSGFLFLVYTCIPFPLTGGLGFCWSDW